MPSPRAHLPQRLCTEAAVVAHALQVLHSFHVHRFTGGGAPVVGRLPLLLFAPALLRPPLLVLRLRLQYEGRRRRHVAGTEAQRAGRLQPFTYVEGL